MSIDIQLWFWKRHVTLWIWGWMSHEICQTYTLSAFPGNWHICCLNLSYFLALNSGSQLQDIAKHSWTFFWVNASSKTEFRNHQRVIIDDLVAMRLFSYNLIKLLKIIDWQMVQMSAWQVRIQASHGYYLVTITKLDEANSVSFLSRTPILGS